MSMLLFVLLTLTVFADNSFAESNCPDNWIDCGNGKCIAGRWRCDGDNDCGNFKDEQNCDGLSPEQCTSSQFRCQLDRHCITNAWICDGDRDCRDGSDEHSCDQSCNAIEPPCSQNCRQTPKSKECYCNDGFTLGEDGKTCNDVNECFVEGFCSQQCTNRIGSFECSCIEGYRPVNNTCLATGPEPILVFSTQHEIRVMSLRTRKHFPIYRDAVKPISVDVDPLESRVYWVEISNKPAVHSSKLNGSDFSIILTEGLIDPEGIAVDYVARNLYFTDSGLKQILACKMKGSMCHALHSQNIDTPRAIAVDPPEGLLYWSDWGENTTGIHRSGVDGSRRITLVSKDIKWPNGIAIDHSSNRLYWSDAKILTIEYITLDGAFRKVLIKNKVIHLYSLAVFEDNLYWSDWTTFTLESSNKFTGHNTTIMFHENGKHIMGVQVYHPVLARRDEWCEDPPLNFVPNGQLEVSRTKTLLACNEGFKEKDNRRIYATCEGNNWSYMQLQCIEILCNFIVTDLSQSEGEWHADSKTHKMSVGTESSLKCKPGFHPEGTPLTVICEKNGKWTTTSATCKRDESKEDYKTLAISIGALNAVLMLVLLGFIIFWMKRKRTREPFVMYQPGENNIYSTPLSCGGRDCSVPSQTDDSIANYDEIQENQCVPSASPLDLPTLHLNFERGYKKPVDDCLC